MLLEALATGGAALLSGGLTAAAGYYNNERNIAMQRETNQMNERLMRENWSREDNAVQRRKADLVAAGLSPVLAAGSGAQSSAPIKMDSPKSEDWGAPATGAAMQGILGATQVSKTQMDNERTAAEIGKIGAETVNTMTNTLATEQGMEQQLIMNKFQSGAISAATARDLIEASRRRYELERDKQFGLGEKSTTLSRQAQDAAGLMIKGAEEQRKYDKKQQENFKKNKANDLNEVWKKTKFGY